MKDEQPPLRERTKTYALRVIKLYSALPKTTEAQVIGKQLLRSGTSVGANYREGFRARSDAEMAAKFSICIQELADGPVFEPDHTRHAIYQAAIARQGWLYDRLIAAN